MSSCQRSSLIALLAACCGVLVWFGLTVRRPYLGLMFLALAALLWVPMALLVPVREAPP